MRHPTALLLLFVLVAGCGYVSGEHSSEVSAGEAAKAPAAAVDDLEQGLTERLTAAGFVPCKPARPRTMQLGALAKSWHCGKLDGIAVEAAITRPGEDQAAIGLDLRADLDGPKPQIRSVEDTIVSFRDQIADWLAARLAKDPRFGSQRISTSGAWLACDTSCQRQRQAPRPPI
jgi:hypothetical protein